MIYVCVGEGGGEEEKKGISFSKTTKKNLVSSWHKFTPPETDLFFEAWLDVVMEMHASFPTVLGFHTFKLKYLR